MKFYIYLALTVLLFVPIFNASLYVIGKDKTRPMPSEFVQNCVHVLGAAFLIYLNVRLMMIWDFDSWWGVVELAIISAVTFASSHTFALFVGGSSSEE